MDNLPEDIYTEVIPFFSYLYTKYGVKCLCDKQEYPFVDHPIYGYINRGYFLDIENKNFLEILQEIEIFNSNCTIVRICVSINGHRNYNDRSINSLSLNFEYLKKTQIIHRFTIETIKEFLQYDKKVFSHLELYNGDENIYTYCYISNKQSKIENHILIQIVDSYMVLLKKYNPPLSIENVTFDIIIELQKYLYNDIARIVLLYYSETLVV